MKRNNRILTLVIAILLCMTGCGTLKATVIDNDGKQSEFTSQELIQDNKDNSVRFQKLYQGAEINIEGKVESIVDTGVAICVKFSDNWAIVLYNNKYYEGDISPKFRDFVSTLNKGDKIRYNGSIKMVGTNCGTEDTVELDIDKESTYGLLK